MDMLLTTTWPDVVMAALPVVLFLGMLWIISR